MSEKQTLSRHKIDTLSNYLFIFCLIVLLFTGWWWPGILLAVWATLGLRQWLTDRHFDLAVTSCILWGLLFINYFDLSLSVLIPVLFIIGGLYIVFREFLYGRDDEPIDKSRAIKDDADLD